MSEKKLIEIDDKVIKVLETVKEPNYKSIIDNKERIFELANMCEKTNFYQEHKTSADTFENSYNDLDDFKERVVQCYWHILQKIANAPTKLHADGSVILVFPVLKNLICLSEMES